MKIGQLENKAITPAAGERRTGGSAQTPGVEASAKVELSSTVTQLASEGNEGVFDAEKVRKISDAIRDGKFQVNPEAIADKLISNAQELLGKVGKA